MLRATLISFAMVAEYTYTHNPAHAPQFISHSHHDDHDDRRNYDYAHDYGDHHLRHYYHCYYYSYTPYYYFAF